MQQVLQNTVTCNNCATTAGLLKLQAKMQVGDTALKDRVLREIVVT